MNTTAFAEKRETNTENRKIDIPDEKEKKSGGKKSLVIMTAISLSILIIAVGMIYYYVNVNPGIPRKNDQTVAASENSGFVNPDSIQQLENDDSNFTMEPAENSDVFIICGGVFMAVMAGAFVFVKVTESKEDN